jgi:hypothetical protein
MWKGYTDIATLTIQGSSYIAVTEYFAGNITLQADTVYQISKVN